MILTAALAAAAAPRAPPLVAQPKPAKRMVFGSTEYKAAVPRAALLRHVLLTHVSYVLSVGLVQTAVYSCLPYMKDSGILTQRQISRMLTVGTACFVVGKLSTAQILDLVGPKAAFITNMLIGSLLCFTFASGAPGLAAEVSWGAYKLWSATSWPSVVQMLAYWSDRRDSVNAFALYSTASRTGAIVASLGVGVLMRRSERGWQLALCGTGVATLLVFLLCKGVVDETPARVLGPHVTAASALEPPRAHPLVVAWRRRVRRLEAVREPAHSGPGSGPHSGPQARAHSPPPQKLSRPLKVPPGSERSSHAAWVPQSGSGSARVPDQSRPMPLPFERPRRGGSSSCRGSATGHHCGGASLPDPTTLSTSSRRRSCTCSPAAPTFGSRSALRWGTVRSGSSKRSSPSF